MRNDEDFGDQGHWRSGFREFRHNSCLMAPASLVLFLLFCAGSVLTLLFQLPGFIIGIFMGPIMMRTPWFIEFLYPWSIGRWAHLFLVRRSMKNRDRDDKNRGFHSRCVEQKFEIVPGRVYVHPIPQLMDNIGYLIVCVPLPAHTETDMPPKKSSKVTVYDQTKVPIVAVMIDCGDAEATHDAVELIQEFHYPKYPEIQIHAIISTHKHHDHTGGNYPLFNHSARGKYIDHIYGGAVERVPHCTQPVINGDLIPLPKVGRNDMGALAELEVVAVPAHTRGSLVLMLRATKVRPGDAVEFLFTGDTMFSCGGGVPFEADKGGKGYAEGGDGNTPIRPGVGASAIERCFAEILARTFPNEMNRPSLTDRMLIFPGHEYTSDLLTRQFYVNATDPASAMAEACRWKNFAPHEFFQTVSEYYVAMHRRSLPHNSGKLLTVPSPITRELATSPYFRSLKRNGELVVRALLFWYNNFSSKDTKLNLKDSSKQSKKLAPKGRQNGKKEPSKPKRWNVSPEDVMQSTFTTVYTADLDELIERLASGKLSGADAAKRLRTLHTKLQEPVINKRSIPGFLTADKNIHRGIFALALLGSPPCAMTLTDSVAMNLPPPVDANSDRIRVSKIRLLKVLDRLGVLDRDGCGDQIRAIIEELWLQSRPYGYPNDSHKRNSSRTTDTESYGEAYDEMELGVLKWMLYGVPSNQPSWFNIFCMPCGTSQPSPRTFPDHPAAKMRQKAGDLVSHDILTCKLCRNAAGCPMAPSKTSNAVSQRVEVSDTSHSVAEESQELFLTEHV